MCHECKVKQATINGLQEQLKLLQGRLSDIKAAMEYAEGPGAGFARRQATTMYLPIPEIQEKRLSPRAIRDRVNGFVKD